MDRPHRTSRMAAAFIIIASLAVPVTWSGATAQACDIEGTSGDDTLTGTAAPVGTVRCGAVG